MVVRVLVAPAAFKGTLSAAEAAVAIADGVRRALPHAEVVLQPIADGGDGSVDAVVSAGFAAHPVVVSGPTGVRHPARIAVRGTTVVVEVANTCGLSLLPHGEPAPMTASTFGLGEAVRAALDAGAVEIVLCLGGSASTDGGAGLLTALGARVLDARGQPVPLGGAGLLAAATIDLEQLDPRTDLARFAVAVDVTSPLAGPAGAAQVFAPQKGASTSDVQRLDAGLRNWSRLLVDATGRDVANEPGAGAAGGTAAAAMAVLGARVVSGATYIQDAVGLPGEIAASDLVITGEGRLDQQSLLGKGPVAVIRLATAAGVPVLAVCGQITLPDAELRALGLAAWSAVVG